MQQSERIASIPQRLRYLVVVVALLFGLAGLFAEYVVEDKYATELVAVAVAFLSAIVAAYIKYRQQKHAQELERDE